MQRRNPPKWLLAFLMLLLSAGCNANSNGIDVSSSQYPINPFEFRPDYSCEVNHRSGAKVDEIAGISVRYHREVFVDKEGTDRLYLSSVKIPSVKCAYLILVAHPTSGLAPLILDPTSGGFVESEQVAKQDEFLQQSIDDCLVGSKNESDCYIQAVIELEASGATIGHWMFDGQDFRRNTLLILSNKAMNIGG